MNRGALLMAAALTAAYPAAANQKARGLSGVVLSPDDRPVSRGTVTIRSLASEAIVSIGADGRFAIDPPFLRSLDVQISSPGLMSRRLRITLPPSRRLTLPPLRLAPAAYVRVRLLSPGGEPLVGVPVTRSSYELNGEPIRERDYDPRPPSNETDGATVIGPLPRGMALLAVDAPPLARMRLKDVRVTGADLLIDAGAVTVHPGATLRVRLVDHAGAPVPRHPVSLDDGQLLTPIGILSARTDEEGVVVFDRLAAGSYRLRTSGPRRCPDRFPTIERPIRVPNAGTVNERIVLDGVKLAVRFTSGAALPAGVGITPDSRPLAMPAWLRDPDPFMAMRYRLGSLAESSCPGDADRSGRFLFVNVPSGPARIDMRVGSSTWTRRITVPPQGGELTLRVAEGIAPLRVVSAEDGAPIAGVTVTWQSRGVRIEALTQANGEVLLQGVPDGAARVTVRSPGFRPLDMTMAGAPDVLHEIKLERPPDPSLSFSVANDIGKPVAAAVIQVIPVDPMEVTRIASTDADGVVEFSSLPVGAIRIVVTAAGFTPNTQSANVEAKNARVAITLDRERSR